MAEPKDARAGTASVAGDHGVRLDSWKEIAAYVKRDVRTLQRWEKTAGLPVRRMQKPGLRAVYAYTADLDQWLLNQGSLDDTPEPPEAPAVPQGVTGPAAPSHRRIGVWALTAAVIAVAAVVARAASGFTPVGAGLH